ncbi:TetR/AcrR family transcriptional regulator [Cellulomonas sp. KRMCY2]|uniref:TetR/AcrR family transcriptional regulator n=1 Tax=Cellulomonas sp. KRMCY2 TaxID=1304865 RepID=UPI00045E65D5|nr:TetR/AcrR family transcriptional regulator [Cellulomonas sp. KRMCY2]
MIQRRDARHNRARIVAAAAEVFREDGAAAPLQRIARRAGVGHGTLYRHFPDRGALIAAVLEMRLDALERDARDHPDADVLEHLLVEICAFQLDAPGLMTAVRRSTPAHARVDAVVERAQTLLSVALDAAHRSGAVRADVTLTDVFLAIAMIDGVIAARPAAPGAVPVERALTLVLRSLRREDRAGLPVPRPELHLPTPEELGTEP